MTIPIVPIVSVALEPVVSWPREAAPGGRYLVTVDLRLRYGQATWPYPDEEYAVGFMLSGRRHLTVSTLGDASVVLHRFGGTYGPARFVVEVDGAAGEGVDTELWLTLISTGGVPFHTAKLPVTLTRDAPVRPPAVGVPPVPQAVPGMELPRLAGTGSDAWSMAAIVVAGRPLLALGTDDGALRLWQLDASLPTELRIGNGPAHLVPLPATDGRTLLAAASGDTVVLIDPATGSTVNRMQRKGSETITALTALKRRDGSTWVAVGTSRGSVDLADTSRASFQYLRMAGHRGPVFAMTSFNSDGTTLLASAGADSTLRIWDPEHASLLRELASHTAQINDITTVRDEKGRPLIASASDDGSIRIWDPVTGALASAFTGLDEWINAVTEVPPRPGERPLLVWGGRDGTLGWSDRLTDSYSLEPGDRRRVTALTSFERTGRSILAIARAGGYVELRDATAMTAEERGPARPKSNGADFNRTVDAIIVIPGFMGSELADAKSGKTLWGLSDARWYVSAWTTGSSIRALKLTAEERTGRTDRVRATRLLRTPAFAPVLTGIEPYTDLVSSLHRVCRNPDAILEFAYDWRLSVAHNADALARAAEHHLWRWRHHQQGSAEARLVLVAHGLGGLIARYYTGVLGGRADTRLTIGIGVPYFGTIAAVEALQGSRLLPRHRLSELVRTLPGMYDLLPSYRCVDDEHDVRRLTADDIARIGGDPDLANEAIASNLRLASVDAGPTRSVIGVGQPTAQSLALRTGSLVAQGFLPTQDSDGTLMRDSAGRLRRVDQQGDGTVPRFSALPPGEDALPPLYVAQTAGRLPRDRNVITYVSTLVTKQPIGPVL
jgi:Lecithin:cholesterol acyltransferase/WD domain, G-beta repeat